jgi:uncharacterized protein
MALFANHAHLNPAEIMPQARAEDLLRLMGACGIERAVCFAPFAGQAAEAGVADASRWLAEEIADRPELVGFATLNPVAPEAVAAVRRAHELGLRGVKLHPAVDRFDVCAPQAMEFYAVAAELGMPLDFHTGVHASRLRDWEMLKFDDVAWDVPGVRMILEHMGSRPFFSRTLAVIGNHLQEAGPRIFAGATTCLNPAIPLWYLGAERIEEVARLLGQQVLVYGLDFPYNSAEVVRHELEMYRAMDLGEGGLEGLLGGNLARVLGD